MFSLSFKKGERVGLDVKWRTLVLSELRTVVDTESFVPLWEKAASSEPRPLQWLWGLRETLP